MPVIKKMLKILLSLAAIIIFLFLMLLGQIRLQDHMVRKLADEYVQHVLSSRELKKKYKIPEKIELAVNDPIYFDASLWSYEVSYPCLPSGEIYMNINPRYFPLLIFTKNGFKVISINYLEKGNNNFELQYVEDESID